jgi:integrase
MDYSVPKTRRGLFQCAMLTGARLGELLGLQWKHIDFESQTLEIRQALWEGELVTPKTEGSARVILLRPFAPVGSDGGEAELQSQRLGGLRLLQGRRCAAQS